MGGRLLAESMPDGILNRERCDLSEDVDSFRRFGIQDMLPNRDDLLP